MSKELKLEVGKTYQSRSGTYQYQCIHVGTERAIFVVAGVPDPGATMRWLNGQASMGQEGANDIVAEYVPPVVEKRYQTIVKHELNDTFSGWRGLSRQVDEGPHSPSKWQAIGVVEYTFTDGKLTGVRILDEKELGE